jgi:hypothetical protein
MVFNTGLVVCVLVAIGGLAYLDPWFGASAAGGAAVAGLVLVSRRHRVNPLPDGAEKSRETVGGLYSTRHIGGTLPVEERHASHVELETARYVATDGWEEEMLS